MVTASVPYHRGPQWARAVLAVIVSGSVLILSGLLPATSFSSPSDRIGILVFLAVFFGICVLAFTSANRDRRAEIDATGIRWYVGKGLKRAIGWPVVKSVEYGNLTTSMGTFRPRTNEYLLFFGPNGKVLLRVNNFLYQSAPGSIHRAIEVTESIAKTRGIQVVNKDVRF